MPPGGAPAAPAASSPISVGPEVGPVVYTGVPPVPEVSPQNAAQNQALASRLAEAPDTAFDALTSGIPSAETQPQPGQVEAETAAQKIVEVVNGQDKKEATLSPDDRAIAETFTDMIMKEPDNFKKFFEAMTKDDPDGAKALAENLAKYKQIMNKEDKARYNKIYMALGIVAFLAWLAFGVATSDGQH